MRESFVKILTRLAQKDKSIILLTADLGYGLFDKFAKKFPKQFYNVGIAEQNMIGVATGLALTGKKIITYSIGNFGTLRCLEQIRNDACYHKCNITIVGSGGGFSYGQLGMSHHATEDISIMRAVPQLEVYCPSTSWECEDIFKKIINLKCTKYFRIEKNNADVLLKKKNFKLNQAIRYLDGNDFSIFAIGSILNEAILASNELKKSNINVRVSSFPSIKSLDVKEIRLACKQTKGILTLEENVLAGGFGTAISEVFYVNNFFPKKLIKLGIPDKFTSVVGDQNFLRNYHKINKDEIIRLIKLTVKK